MVRSGIGDAPKRREDLRFLTGQGRYLDDLAFDRLTHAVVLRSTHAHAEIARIDTAAAKAMPGVLAVLTAANAIADGLKPLPPYVEANTQTGDPFAFTPQPLLAEDKVRYVGEPVALIVAESRDQAVDAAERITVDYVPLHGSSRATYMGGTAIWRAADITIEKGRRIVAEALEAAEADIRFEDGRFVVAGTDRAIDLLRVAAIAREAEDPLDTYYAWTREWMTFPNGAHVVEVEIDRDTGEVNLAGYTAVDDYGVVVNPMVAAGQAHGAIAQGAGQALLERASYDPASGQLLAGSFMDYPLPRADDLVPFQLGFNPTRCTTNPLGVKGCGEAGMVGAFPAITNAILDALAPLGISEIDGPATPYSVWRAISRVK
jgi:CO/xanthine dehydrogenase Mo-binding subunit